MRSDSVSSIAKYLHLTDPYIYPKICNDPLDPDWINLIRLCSGTDRNLFHIRHLFVALHKEEIVGILCAIPCGSELNFIERFRENLPKEFLTRLTPVIEGYFDPLLSESRSYEGYNITNVCVDAAHRKNGFGKLLLARCVEEYGESLLHLDVIADNEAAIRLYQQFGFNVSEEYYGYSGDDTKLPCYHMIRTPRK